MIAPDALTEALARAVGDAWFEACEQPTRWPAATMDQRDTFRAMARSALAAARAGQRGEDDVAQALCHAFWAGAPLPRVWGSHGQQQREVFKICARAMIAAARAAKSARSDERRSQRQAEPQEQAA